MFKKIVLVLSILLTSQLFAESAFDRANSAAEKASKGLDCEFEDCKPEPPKVIIKKEYVPIIVVKEKIVTKEVPIYTDRVIYKERKVNTKQKLYDRERLYGTLLVDISVPNDPTFISDYVHVTDGAGDLNWNTIKSEFMGASDRGPFKIKLTGMIELPRGIDAQRIYIKPILGPMNSSLKVDGISWNIKEINMLNAYSDTRVIPFSFTMSYSWSKKGFIQEIEKYLPRVRFLVSNKPESRGERKNFVQTKVFVYK